MNGPFVWPKAIARCCCLVLIASALALNAFAADPQPYAVDIDRTGDRRLDEILRQSSQLANLRETAPVPPFALIERARSDMPRFQIALDSFGYYKNDVAVTISGLALTDPALSETLDAASGSVPVHVIVRPGPLYRLGSIDVQGDVPPSARAALDIKSGDPAIASVVLDSGARILAALQEDGYALADVQPPDAFADDEKQLINLVYHVKPGRRATLGDIRFKGLVDVRESFALAALDLKPGARYRPSQIEAARQQLASLGVFSGVTVRADETIAPNGEIGLTFDVAERARHTVKLSGDYSTDLGVSLSVGWSHHNLLGGAEQLNLTAAGTGLGTASAGLGYEVGAEFIKPVFLRPNQVLQVELSGVKQQLEAYDQTAETLSVNVRRKFSALWSGSAGMSLIYDEVTQQAVTRLYQLAELPVSINYDSTALLDPLQEAASGARLSLAVTPTQAFGASNLTFALLQASGSTYFDLTGDRRSILALRALAGSILGGSNLEVPPDQRLYAGGSATIRGFAYQSVGPQFADGTPVGAKSVNAATVELRQRIGEDWGAAAFVDAGQASAAELPFRGAVRVGAGVGARYYTSFGVVRTDIAVPVTPIRGGDSFQLYIGLGQAF
jgi:translocation and assembly module TamA